MKEGLDMSAAGVTGRLKQAAELSDLGMARAFEGKVSLAAAAVSARLRTVGQLRSLGLRLAAAGRAADGSGGSGG